MKQLINILLVANLIQLVVTLFLIEYALDKHDAAVFNSYINNKLKKNIQKEIVKTNTVIKANTIYLPWLPGQEKK